MTGDQLKSHVGRAGYPGEGAPLGERITID